LKVRAPSHPQAFTFRRVHSIEYNHPARGLQETVNCQRQRAIWTQISIDTSLHELLRIDDIIWASFTTADFSSVSSGGSATRCFGWSLSLGYWLCMGRGCDVRVRLCVLFSQG